jgi:electron-transferring-flavoprotein dehydrogenase
MDLDVVFVGAGPANLSGAYHLAKLIEKHNGNLGDGQSPLEVEIAVLEKGKEIGSHALSGAVLDPRALKELFPDTWQDAPFEAPVGKEDVSLLTEKKAFSFPILPPAFHNHGNYVCSLGKLVKWMAPQVEEAGVDIFTEFAASEALIEGGRVLGVRTGDRGIDHQGNPKANFEPGMDIHTRVTVLGEGPRGTLAKQLEEKLDLGAGQNPQIYAIGIKEIWEVPDGRIEPGEVIHTMGWPLDTKTFGGGFLYGMQDSQFIVGLVVGLDYQNPWLDPHAEFQRMKTHPRIRKLIEGGKMTYYGAKALPEGGWFSMPKSHGDGFLIVGDSAGMLNSERLKGIHLAMKSGMLAAETLFDGLVRDDLSADSLAGYKNRIDASWIKKEMWPVRNFHQAFDKGLFAGMFQAGAGMVTGGRGWGFKNRLDTHAGHERMIDLTSPQGKGLKPAAPVAYDGKLTFDRLGDVFNSGTTHEEDQPVHLLVSDPNICVTRCTVEYGNPCERFCPAAVYEMVEDPTTTGKRLQINASNCVHCKTCDIMDPYQIITWVPPEGGGGPNYGRM